MKLRDRWRKPKADPVRWKVQAEPPTRPGFKYKATFFDSLDDAERFAERLRRDGCYCDPPALVPVGGDDDRD